MVLKSPAAARSARRRVFSDLACAIADRARVISDFRAMGDQRELLGPVASLPAAWRTLGGDGRRRDRRRRIITAAVNKARGTRGRGASQGTAGRRQSG